VDASSNDRAAIEEEIRNLAYRANKMAGFARGDINDDGVVDALDLSRLTAIVLGYSNVQIFPHPDNADVDLNGFIDPSDVTYLFNYLMGGPAPRGEWRFDFMP
jgi:hypothetical protein